jgi:hypothetical protein
MDKSGIWRDIYLCLVIHLTRQYSSLSQLTGKKALAKQEQSERVKIISSFQFILKQEFSGIKPHLKSEFERVVMEIGA